jgi:hypothetical protein
LKKLALRGSEILPGDILSGVWWFPDGKGEVVSLSLFEGTTKGFAGVGSQVATIKGSDRKLTLPQVNWYIVQRNIENV